MIERLCLAGERVAVVVGKAGTGKTFALAAAREAWHASNRAVLGVAVARRAANQLQSDAGIASTSVAALVADLDRPGGELPAGAVLVVDEAGMIATRQLAKLLEAVERADGKLVLVGDHRQLPELEAGGTFRALVRRGLAIELTENRRQREAWERNALDELRDGDPGSAIAAYVAHERVHASDLPAQTRRQLVADWHRASDAGESVMIAQRRSDVADLNRRARLLLREAGRLGPDEIRIADNWFALGDRVVIKRNDVRLGVTNGDRGTVVAVDGDAQRLVVRLEDTAIALDRDFLGTPTIHGDPPLMHGYAITCHVAQGLTVDRAFVLADERLTREVAYTALSRGRRTNHLYLTEDPDTPSAEYAPSASREGTALARLVGALKTSRATSLAIDAGEPDAADQLALARHELAAARGAVSEFDRSRWRPRRREQRERARQRESIARERVVMLARAAAEQRHADRRFVEERSVAERAASVRDRLVERRLDRGRSRGREL
jgi:ATP-dependent exoDNAse (exonuclease V) alpha subunit